MISFFTSKTAIETLWLGKNIKEAIDLPHVHHQLSPHYAQFESDFPAKLFPQSVS